LFGKDKLDAVWCKLAERGMLRPSFIPPPWQRELRDLCRYRRTLIPVTAWAGGLAETAPERSRAGRGVFSNGVQAYLAGSRLWILDQTSISRAKVTSGRILWQLPGSSGYRAAWCRSRPAGWRWPGAGRSSSSGPGRRAAPDQPTAARKPALPRRSGPRRPQAASTAICGPSDP
jgi:hypothetical protein